MKKFERKDKNEKRRLAFKKRNVKKEMNLARYGAEGGSALIMAKTGDFNRRFMAAFLALVFAISTMVLGLNFATKAEESASTPDPADYLEVNKTISANTDGTYNINLEAYAKGEISDIAVTEKIPTDFIVVVDQSGSMATTDMVADTNSYQSAGTVNLETAANGGYYYYDSTTDQYYQVYGRRGYLNYLYASKNTAYADDLYGTDMFYFFSGESTTASGAKGYYYYHPTDKVFYPITLNVKGTIVGFNYQCRFYYSKDGTLNLLKGPDHDYHDWRAVQIPFTTTGARLDSACDYLQFDAYRRVVAPVMLCYRDINGKEVILETTDGKTSTDFGNIDSNNNVYATQTLNGTSRMQYSGLYTANASGAKVKRLDALSVALNQFAQAVAEETDTFGAVDNRIAIVGFSSEGYKNTELLTGSTIDYSTNGYSFNEGVYYFPYKGQNYNPATNGSNGGTNYRGPQYYSSDAGTLVTNPHYAAALISANNGTAGTVNPDGTKGIKSITAYGGTKPEDGFDMALKVYQNRSKTKYTIRSGDQAGQEVERNKIVIFFTDGQPGMYPYSDQYAGANAVVQKAYDLKHYKNPGSNTEVPAAIFSIGVFSEADSNPLTYEDSNADSDSVYDFDYAKTYTYNGTNHYLFRYWLSNDSSRYGDAPNDTIYDYMSVVSSNYPNAQTFMDDNWEHSSSESWKDMTARVRGNYIGQNNYYRMASNQDTLVEAFKSAVTINTIETSTSTTTINDSAILRDVITGDFNTNIETDKNKVVTSGVSVQAFPCINVADGVPVFSPVGEPVDNLTIKYYSDTRTLDVSGFDYGSNYSAESSASHGDILGKKLVVTIESVTPKATVTGDIIYTNDSSSGIYTEPPTDRLVEAFPKPAIARYKYELNVTGVDADAQFNLKYALAANQGVTEDFDNILVSNEGLPPGIQNRERYSAGNLNSITNATNGSTIYLEYITEQGGNGVVNPADYSLTTTIVPSSADANSYTYYLDTTGYVDLDNHPDPNKVLPQPDGMIVTSLKTTENGAMYVDSNANNRNVTFHLDANESPFVDSEYKFSVEVTLTGTDIASKLSALNNDNSNIQFTQVDANTISGTVKIVYGNGNPIDTVTIKVPDGATLSVAHSDPFYTTEYISEDDDGAPAYTAHAIRAATDIYIKDTVNNDVGAGVMDNNAPHIILYVLGGLGVVSAAGAAYVYRKKDEFVAR